MRKDWEYKKLGEVAFYPNDKISVDKIGANHYVGVENLLKDKAGILFSDQLPNAATATCFKYNDILLGNIRPYLKKIWLSNTEGGASGDVIVIRTSSDNILPNYLFKLLSSDKFFNYFNLYTKGAKMPRGDKNAIAKFIVPTPPKPTQLAIVAELDKINELIQLKKQQLKDYDQLAQSIFYEMFGDPVENEKGWEVKKLGDICEVTSAKRVFIEEVVDSGVPFIRGTELTALNRLTRGEKMKYSLFITKEHYERLKAITGVPKYGDLLIPSINSEGIAWIVNTEEPLYFKDGRVLWVHVNQDVFKSECLQKIMNILLKHTYKSMGGATFSELKLFVLRELKVPIPPIESQQQFAARIEAIERQKQQVSETIKDLETLLASRMQYWFD